MKFSARIILPWLATMTVFIQETPSSEAWVVPLSPMPSLRSKSPVVQSSMQLQSTGQSALVACWRNRQSRKRPWSALGMAGSAASAPVGKQRETTRATATETQMSSRQPSPSEYKLLDGYRSLNNNNDNGDGDNDDENNSNINNKRGNGIVHHLENEEQHKKFLEDHSDALVVMKFYAPWCKACKALAPKFLGLSKDKKYSKLPIVFAELSVAGNKDYIKSLGIVALPTVQFYAPTTFAKTDPGSASILDSFPCGPSKFNTLKRKIALVVNEYVDARTLGIKAEKISGPQVLHDEDAPVQIRPLVETKPTPTTEIQIPKVSKSAEKQDSVHPSEKILREQVPYFADLPREEFRKLVEKAKLLSFDEGSIIMREGKPGRTFYVIESGEVEICCKTAYEDPLVSSSGYLGTVINRLSPHDYFGERSLITGEPRAASIRALENTKCWAFDVDDMPPQTVLSGKRQATPSRLEQVNTKYGVEFHDLDMLEITKQLEASKLGSQIRGSVIHPEPIIGVDVEAPDDAETEVEIPSSPVPLPSPLSLPEEDVLNLLQRFKLLQYATRCFDYIVEARPIWGTPGALRRRSMLVSKLSSARKQEFAEAFNLIDTSGNNEISLLELKRVMETLGEAKTNNEYQEMMNGGHNGNGNGKDQDLHESTLTMDDFMGIMAEAEFYHLFKDVFGALDKHDTGFVRAGDLDRVLCGLRDLISDDRNSIIDVDDKDMMINYEQFSRMLLGSPL